jgi:hypothetical protein
VIVIFNVITNFSALTIERFSANVLGLADECRERRSYLNAQREKLPKMIRKYKIKGQTVFGRFGSGS